MAKKSSRASQKAQVSAAQARLAEMKAQQSRREARGRALLFTVLGVVVVLVIGVVAYIVVNHKAAKDVVQPALVSVADDSGIQGVKAWQYTKPGATAASGDIAQTHVPGKSVEYAQKPPVGGPHDPVWLNCGVYSSTPRLENAVHDLEHGAIWITYRPDLPADQKKALRDLYDRTGTVTLTSASQSVDTKERFLDLFPYADQTSPVVLTSWGHQLDLTSATDERIQKFIDTFRVSQTYTPEYGSSCGGQPKSGNSGKPEA